MHSHRLIALTLVALACQEPDSPVLRSLVPEIAVAPDAIDFGERPATLTWRETIYVSNGGRAPLEVSLAITGEHASVFDVPITEATVEAGSTQPFDVVFTPDTFLAFSAELVLTSNDEDTPELAVPLSGTGVPAPLPDIALSRTSLDFGEVDGTAATDLFIIENVGSADLTLGNVSQVGSGAFALLSDPSGDTLSPGDEVPVVVQYTPTSTDGDSGELQIASDDPDEPTVRVVLLGNGGADFGYPEARIDCPGIVNPPTFVRLDGSDSVDPEDPTGTAPLTYAWRLDRVPVDASSSTPISSAYLSNDVGDYTELFADAVGDYEVSLVVTNSLGITSAPAVCRIQALPAEQILVELTWSTANADLDLHLARQGFDLFERPGDASWCNGSPSWGVAGSADDPSLNLDDRAGFGPENIAIDIPANDRYDVRVHYFDDQGDDVVTATVRVYVEGALAAGFPQSRNLTRNQVWDVARINWPEATVALLSTALYDADERQCFTP